MDFKSLNQWPSDMKKLVAVFISVLTAGMIVGLIFIFANSDAHLGGMVENYRGSETVDQFEIPEKYPKAFKSMLLTTHTHIISFSVIYFLVGGIFGFTSIISGRWKTFLMVEPLVATLVTFGSIWALRYINPAFGYLTMVSGILMYGTYFLMAVIILYEIILKKN